MVEGNSTWSRLPSMVDEAVYSGDMHVVAPTAKQIVEVVLIEQHTTILPFKPNNWVLCYQPVM